MRTLYAVIFLFLAVAPLRAQEEGSGAVVLDERDRLIRERYEQVLQRDPLQDAAFDRVYESYMLTEGVDAWLGKLKSAEGEVETAGSLVLRGRILARQFKAGEAVEALSKARELGEGSAAFNALLGRLYYETGKDDDAITLLGAALDASESPEQRSELCRMLGSVYLRSGKRAEAAAVWERIAELNPNDLFALQELAEIYEENRMWDEAIAARQRIVAAASNDPYRQCHAWRAIGQSLLAKDDHAGAIAAFEQGLALAAPGNWLFEDLKGRLVGVYESRGDLEGLSAYLEARIAQDPTDLSLSELLADVSMRRNDLAKAEALLKDIIARAPGRVSALEMLIGLYRHAGRMDDLAATFESLIAQYPAEPDYLWRLGEAWLEQKAPEKALETWRRVVGDGSKAGNHAQLAEWLERSEFFPEAAAAYEAALAIQPDREWRLRLASLKYDMGEEEAALAAWQAAVAPEDTPAGEVAEIAAILLSKEFKAEAEALYARAMALEPDNLDHVLAYARLLTAREDHEGAVAQYTRLAEQDTSEYLKNEGERGLLDAYEALGTLDQQRAAWEEAITQAPGDTVARLKLARLYARLGNRPGVVKLYEECIAIDPERTEFQRLLAAAYKENRQTEKAIETIEGLMAKDAERSQAYLRDLLALYGASGRPQEAIRSAEKLVELSPSSPEARTALAQAYLRSGEPEKGLQQYRNLVQLDSTQPAYFREFGDALQQLGNFGEAQEIYRKMLETATDDATRFDAVNRLATVYVRNGQRDMLLTEFQRRVSAAPKSLAAYQELAAVYRAAGDLRGAMETLERARGEVEDRDVVLRLVMAEAYQAGDHQKVLAVYEELLARSAQPTPQDLDRLAGAYAQVGRMEDAIAVWERITRENPDDAAVQLQVARQLEAYGLYDEANARTERALEIDPYDYDLRFDYAQQLIGFNEVDKGLEQLKKILDIGERPEAPQANGATPSTASQPPANFSTFSSFQGGMSMNMNMNFSRPYRQRGGFGGVRSRSYGQSFNDVRQQVVQTMVHLSRQFDDAESMVDTYRKRIEAQPENIDARRDYLLVCEASEQPELALEAARELSALQPEDLSLRWRIFGYLQQLKRGDEAIAMAKELSQQPDANLASQARLMHIRLLAESERYGEAEAVLAEVTAEAPEKAQIYLQVAASFQRAENQETAEQLYQKAAELDPRFLNAALTGRARLRQERGDAASARDLYIEAVFAPADEAVQNIFQAKRNFPTPLYMPQGARRGRQSGNNISMLQGYNFPVTDHQRAQALNEAYRLTSTPEEFAPVIERLRAEAEKYVTAESDEARQEASNFAYFYVACLRNTDRDNEAVQAVEALLARRPGDFLLQNFRLFLLDEQGRFEEMLGGYAEIETSNPALAGEVARARLQLALAQEDIAALPALYRALPDTPIGGTVRGNVGMRANQLSQVVRTLENGGARAEARALLEEELARSRDASILIQLSRSSAAEHRYDEAIAYAREAYEKQGVVRGRGQNYQYTMNAMSLQTQGLHGLETLWNAYREAGREQELISDFESRLEGQPTSVTLRESLIGLYMENRQYELARMQMEKLLELRPNDVQLKVRYAGLLESNNDPAGALAVLESVVAARPSASRGIAGEIRRLYKDLGKKDELAALQERMKREARSVNELQELAQQLGQEREFVQAAELLQRALRIEPQNIWLVFQIGDYYWQAGDKSKAAAEYLKLYQPTSPQAGIQVDTGRTPEIIGRIAEAGRLEELKAIATSKHTEEYTVRSLKILEALIARHEGRAEEAEQLLKSIATANADLQISTLLAELAEARGDLAAAIQYLESAGKAAGQTDYQRLATLYLRAGDTGKSLQTWKKFAEQHGGAFGHAQAIRALSGSGAHELLTPYLKEVFASMPASDPARHQLAESIIQINDDSGRYDSLIDSEIFSTEMKTTAELAQRYAGDLGNLPGLARRRIEPIAARFPENRELQALYANTLQESGDVEAAIAIYNTFPRDAEFYKRFGDNVGRLLREAGDIDAWREFVLDCARRPNPTESDITGASRALIESGRRGELAAFREEVLANSEPGQHGRLRASFAGFDAERGDVVGARATLKALAEETNDTAIQARYLKFLIVRGFQTEAGQLYTQWPEEVREAVFKAVRSRGEMGALLASGSTEAAWKELMRRVLRRDAGHDPGGHQIAHELRALGEFCNHVVPASVVDGYIEVIRKQPVLSKTDRFVAAWWEINRGRWPAALEVIGDYREERMFQDLIEQSRDLVPQDLRQEVLNKPIAEPASPQPAASSEAEAAPAPPEATPQSRIKAARELAENGKEQEAVALLDAIPLSNTDTDMLQRRAEAYRAANAPDKAVADLTALLAQRPDDRNVRMELAACLTLAGKPAEAMAAWRESEQPGNVEFARVLLDKSLFAEALEVLGAAGTQGGRAVDIALLRARALQGTGQLEEMIKSLEAVYGDLSADGQEGLVLRLGTELQQSATWQALLDMESLKANTFVNHVLLSMTRNMNPDDAAPLRTALIGRIDPGAITRRDDAENFALVLRAADQRGQAIAVLAAAGKHPRTQRNSDRVLVDALYNLEARSEAAGLLIELSRSGPEILTHDPAYGLYRAEELEDPIMRDALFDRIIELAPTDALATYVTALKTWHGPDKAAGQAALVGFADAPEAQSPQLFRLADLFREQGEDALALKCLERLAGGDYGDEVQDRALLTQISFKQKAGDPAGALEVFARLLPAPLPMRSQAWQEIAAYFGELPYETVEPLIVAMIQANPEHPGVADLVALRTALAVKHELPVPALDPAGLGVPAAREAELRLFGNLITTWAAADIPETNTWSEMARELDNETAALLRGEDVPLPPSREWRALGAGDSFPSLLAGRMSGGFSGVRGIRGASEFLVKLESPDVRTVTLAIGSSDQIRLWVNEGEVYSNRSGRLNLLDTDRVDVTLKQGANWVFVRCRHGQEVNSGVFSLSIVSGAEGLRVLMPSLPVREEEWTDVQAAQ